MNDKNPDEITPYPKGFMIDMRRIGVWLRNIILPHMVKTCSRCGKVAGFWVMRKEAKTVRRPFCLNCTLDFDPDMMRITTFEGYKL